jgi:uncharacterized protein (TIGR02646 family)
MIHIRRIELAKGALDLLASWQREIDRLPSYPERVKAALKQWDNKRRGADFRAVTETLKAMCTGPGRCMYCEDNGATDVEHFRPKAVYPGLVYAWTNYLYACTPCNRSKGNRFAIVSPKTGDIAEILASSVEPEDGAHVLLDPCRDDPFEYLELDLLGTFLFRPIHPEGSIERRRAEYTIRLLGLNERSDLVDARKRAYDGYLAQLGQYVARKKEAKGEDTLERLRRAIQRGNHATVWREMQRQRARIPELCELFELAPELDP